VALPLHIFEERYRAMVARCLDQQAPFGVVLIREGREVGGGDLAIAGIGTFAAIREVERHDDGRYDLLTVGVGRFAIRAVDSDREPYLVARVDPLDDRVEEPDQARLLMRRVTRRFVDYLHLMRPREGEEGGELDVRIEIEVVEEEAGSAEPIGQRSEEPAGTERERGISRRIRVPDDPGALAHLLSGIVQVDLVQKQALLEADTVEERLAGLEVILDHELLLLRRRLRRYEMDERATAARRN
jgi:Lon protease-like protein